MLGVSVWRIPGDSCVYSDLSLLLQINEKHVYFEVGVNASFDYQISDLLQIVLLDLSFIFCTVHIIVFSLIVDHWNCYCNNLYNRVFSLIILIVHLLK